MPRMGVNPYFNNYGYTREQELLEDLLIESMQAVGMPMYYLPRSRVSFDGIYYEDDQSSFEEAIPLEIYMKSYTGFVGQESFFSKFQLEVRDQFTFSIARRRFAQEITSLHPEILRPREGDIIFFPMNGKCFEIRQADNKPFFYQLGELQLYDITCELFEYSDERFNTGIAEIDALQTKHTFNAIDFALTTEDGHPLLTENGNLIVMNEFNTNIEDNEPVADNARIADEAADIIDWQEHNPFNEREPY